MSGAGGWDPTPERAGPEPRPPALAAPEHRGDVLAVDDTPENLTLLATILKGKGYRVRAVPSGALALKAAAAQPPELVLLDVMMPQLDGYETCRRLKADERLRGVPVIFLSALSETLDKVKAFSSGAVDFVTKPFQIEELEARVGAHVALRRLQCQLDARNRELERSNARLRAMEEVRRKLSRMIVHDLKSPIAAATCFARFLRDEANLQGEHAEAAEDLVAAFQVLDRMALDLLDVASSEEGRLVARPRPLDLRALVEELVAASRARARAAGKTLETAVADGAAGLAADPDILRRILENLLDNALKYAPRGGTIRIEAAPEADGGWVVRVRDDGPGIPAALRERVFEPHARLERDVEQHGRSSRGLGLAFCRLAAEAHGGRISVEDAVPAGCAFVLRLPASPGAAAAPAPLP